MRLAKVAILAVCVVGCGLVSSVRVASAANNEAEGRKHARKANHLADLNKCKLAIPEYSKALRLLKDPTLYFNRAECYRRTGESAKAVSDYRKFLVELPAAPNRTQVESQIAALQRPPGAPPGAPATTAPVPVKPPAPRPPVARVAPVAPPLPPSPSAGIDRPRPPAPAPVKREPSIAEATPTSSPPPALDLAPAPSTVEHDAPMALLDTKADANPAADTTEHGSSHWWLWALGAVVVAGGAAGAYLVLNQGKTDIPMSALGNYKF